MLLLSHEETPPPDLDWDAPRMQVKNHRAANVLLKRSYRKGWSMASF